MPELLQSTELMTWTELNPSDETTKTPVLLGQDINYGLDLSFQDSTFTRASTVNVWGYNGDPSASNGPELISVGSNVDAITGARWDGSKFVTTDTSGNTLHPFTLKATNSGNVKVFTEFADYAAGAVSSGDQVAVQTSAGNWVYMTSQADDTAVSVTVTDGDIGGLVADAGGFNWLVEGYATLHKGGYLLEDASTNELLRSEDFGTTWAPTNATVTTDDTVAPDGNTTADKLLETAAAGTSHRINQAGALSTGVVTASVFAKGGLGRDWFLLWFDGDAEGTYFDVTNGAIGTVSAGVTAKIDDVGGGWYRCSVSATATAATGLTLFLAESDGVFTYNGDITKGMYFWGAQYEVSPFATSYIKTEASTVTRAATTLSDTTAGRLTAESGAGRIVVTPSGVQGTVFILSSYVDGSNWTGVFSDGTTLYLRKYVGAVAVNRTFTFTAGVVPFAVEFYYGSSGMGLRAYDIGGAIPAFNTNTDTSNAQIASTFEIGSRGGSLRMDMNVLACELSNDKSDFGW